MKVFIIFKASGHAIKLFINHEVMRMAAALSFYTFFALAPVLMIIIYSTRWIVSDGKIEAGLYSEITNFIGADAALQVQQIIMNSGSLNWSSPASILSVIALIFSATGVFTEIQSSINAIWSLKAKPKKSWLKYIINRFVSLSVIIGLGFILLVSLIVSAGVDIVLNQLSNHFSKETVLFSNLSNLLLTVIIIGFIFGSILKFLPDAKISWRDIIVPSLLTASLFLAGKFLISYYIGKANPAKPYGTAGAIVIILLWVYYSSMILYFGACFTKAFAQRSGRNIYPDDYAVFVEQVEIQNKQSLQKQDDSIAVKSSDVEVVIEPGATIESKKT
ncbi:MAG: YihY/virulence factor BrkB family protein [Chitinophagaceae bacterium]